MDSPAPILPYADGVSDDGVAIVRYPDLIRIIVPPLRRLRDLGKGYFIGAAFLLYGLVGSVAAFANSPRQWDALIPNGVLFGGGSLLMALFIVERLRRRIVFDVAHDNVTLVFYGLFGAQRRVWPRVDVTDVHMSAYSKKLVIRVRGHDLMEFDLGSDQDLNRRTADELAAAIAHPPAPSALPPQARAVPVGNRSAVQSAVVRRICVAIAVVIAVVAIGVMTQVGFAAFPLLLFTAVPLGTAYGTQEKEFYV
jgi:hypothetical protein